MISLTGYFLGEALSQGEPNIPVIAVTSFCVSNPFTFTQKQLETHETDAIYHWSNLTLFWNNEDRQQRGYSSYMFFLPCCRYRKNCSSMVTLLFYLNVAAHHTNANLFNCSAKNCLFHMELCGVLNDFVYIILFKICALVCTFLDAYNHKSSPQGSGWE